MGTKLLTLLKSSTLKDTAVLSIGLAVTALIGFIYTVVLARTLEPSQFGVYSAITALATIIYSLGDLGISPAIINLLPKHPKDKQNYVVTGFWMQFFVAIFIIITFVFASFIHNRVVPGSLTTDFILAGGLSVNYLLINFAQGVFTAEKRFWSYSVSQIIDAVIKIIIVLILFQFSKLTIGSALVANFISTIFALLISFGRDLYRIEFEIQRTVINQIIHFAKWIALSRVFSVMLSKIDIILLNLLSTSHHAGIFSAASRVALFFALFVSSLGSVVNPRFSSFKTRDQVTKYIFKLSLLITAVGIIMLSLGQIAPAIIDLVYGRSYLEAAQIFKYLTIAMLPFLYSVVVVPPLLYTYNQPRFYALLTAFQVIGIIVLDLFFIPIMKSLAPVMAMGVTNLFVLIVSSVYLAKLIRRS